MGPASQVATTSATGHHAHHLLLKSQAMYGVYNYVFEIFPSLINQIICVNLLNVLSFSDPPQFFFLFRLACPFIPFYSALRLTSL